MRQVQVNLRLYEAQLAEIDVLRGDVPRNTWLRRAVLGRLEAERGPVEEPVAPAPRARSCRVVGVPREVRELAEAGPPIPGRVTVDEVLGDEAA